jgi:hypothetical protein
MSANNWTVCPKCFEDLNNKIADSEKSCRDEYGKAPPEAYLDLVKERDDLAAKRMDDNFREDYEIYMQKNGELYISYFGRCDKCGYTKEFSSGNFMKGG